jgi:hypothetical protein
MGQMVLHRSEAADGEVLHLPESGCGVRAGHATGSGSISGERSHSVIPGSVVSVLDAVVSWWSRL